MLVQFTDSSKEVIFDDAGPENSNTIFDNRMALGTTDTDSCSSSDVVTIVIRADFYDAMDNTLFVKVDMSQVAL